jgi:hypothetical protein
MGLSGHNGKRNREVTSVIDLQRLGFVAGALLFDAHVFELTGFKDLATLQALHVFRFLVAAHDLNPRMFARRAQILFRWNWAGSFGGGASRR